MAQQTINIGAAANDGTGDPARTAFGKVNDNFTELYAQSGHGVIGSTVTTKQDDYAPDGWSACRTLRWNGAGSTGITGFDSTDIPDGAERIITNASTDYLLWLENENTASSAANRMALPKGFPAFLMPGDSLTLQYDTTAARWRVIDWPNQGEAMGLTEFTDGLTGSTNGMFGPFAAVAGGTGATASGNKTPTSDSRAQGSIELVTGTTSTGYARIGQSARTVLPRQGFAFCVARLGAETAPDGTENFTLWYGFQYASTGSVGQAVAWEARYTGSAVEWSQTVCTDDVFARQNTNSPSFVANKHEWLAIFSNAGWSRIDFIAASAWGVFEVVGSMTSGIPVGATSFGVSMFKSAGTTSRKAFLDLLGYRLQR